MTKPASRSRPALTKTVVNDEMQQQEFARRLYNRMAEMGLNQSQLAKTLFGTTTDSNGFIVSKGRDRVSCWIRGKNLPDMVNQRKLAKALNMEVEELIPAVEMTSVDRNNPAISFSMVANSDKVHLKINQMVEAKTAFKILELLGATDDRT